MILWEENRMSKKYKKGMADAAKSYTEFGKKQEDALNYILEEVRQGRKGLEEAVQELNGNLDGLYEHLKSKEKAQLYTVYTPFDIKELGKWEKLFLLGSLYCLTIEKTPNENQQNYLRAVQKYLEIKEPPSNVDIMSIENIEDIPTQKAIFQTVLEFLRLQDGDCYDETDMQNSFLDSFSINAKNRQAIFEHVELLYMATGAKGLAEKYGYVPEADEAKDDDTSAAEATREKGMSEETAKKVFKYSEQDRWSMPIETEKYFLVREIEGYWVGAEKRVRAISKSDGKETILTNIDTELLGGWDDSVSIGDKAYAKTGDNRIYEIDVLKGNSRLIYTSNGNFKFVDACNDKLLLELSQNCQIVVIDSNGTQIAMIQNAGPTNRQAVFYNGEVWFTHEVDWKLCRYSINKQQIVSTLGARADMKSFVEKISVHNGKLYILVHVDDADYFWDYDGIGKYSIYSVDLEKPTEFYLVKEKIIIHDRGVGRQHLIKNCSGGWIFVGENSVERFILSADFNVVYFSFETEETIVIAKGCGYEKWFKAGVFSKGKTMHMLNDTQVVGNNVFFIRGNKNDINRTCVMASINEPMATKVVE